MALSNYYNASNSAASIAYQFSAAGTYYVGVSGYPYYDPNVAGSAYASGTGDYQLNLALVTPAADAAGDTIATAQATNLGPAAGTFSATATIGDGLYPLKEVDLYRIDVAVGQMLTAATAQPGSPTPPRIAPGRIAPSESRPTLRADGRCSSAARPTRCAAPLRARSALPRTGPLVWMAPEFRSAERHCHACVILLLSRIQRCRPQFERI